MRKRRHRSRAVFGAALAALLLAVTGCDATGGDSPGPEGTGARAKPSPSPTPTPAWDSTPESLAAVGDSITRGFDACQVLSDCPEVSWATGSDASVDSLAVRLLGAAGAAQRSWNYAVTGARMADLPSQVARAVPRKPELVTVMIGANDACRATAADMTPLADFRADFEDAMATLRDSLPKAQVFVASVPDLKRLWSEGRTNPVGKQVWKLGICPSMLADPDLLTTAAGQRRDAVQDRVEAYNDVLREVCAEDRYCRYDGDAVFDYRFGQTQLSQWDWFHPSVDGQARLAEIAYRIISRKGA
ncbi:SGNH/GDSL hydrolase family protein [Streptomyces europaeiscabiei]|uniref:SGNH/GDSL hydrolase family protein n=2 Tax=Streptomyces europaeiscabiei TaxID=146819 RepID=A0ABU4NBN8_9ACTN|nr:SGNH/GDSL hydrolase family protein [Streptomyces europaeiscabiei]MDX2760539.1 SGNH/GDSL hydrolase family protein [Streptomyces europaeiscabiei]MDX3545251.1 SGNH/GDSL hydrolase family protein [Streptomyces europaeiscabiei]MDX3554242.1 SGNH/GDSL hydrolase family protein [Streptomyces europaeiscabiei]MDX3666482.1 SGNH/GDSL hydrolase family protein [Streptomyces europaeiscabiei]MDX3699507.1 SGNH/GDSL hydrolase family protein [Streptomyces europaeiscabiei]